MLFLLHIGIAELLLLFAIRVLILCDACVLSDEMFKMLCNKFKLLFQSVGFFFDVGYNGPQNLDQYRKF